MSRRNICLTKEEWNLIYQDSPTLQNYYKNQNIKPEYDGNYYFDRNWWTTVVYNESNNNTVKNILAREDYRSQDFSFLGQSIMAFSGWYLNAVDDTKLDTTDEQWQQMIDNLHQYMNDNKDKTFFEWIIRDYFKSFPQSAEKLVENS